MEKEREEALRWFVDFANMNLETIKPGDRVKLFVESKEYLFPTKELEKIQISPQYLIHPKTSPGMAKLVKEQIETITGNMVWAFKEQPKIDSEEYWAKIVDLQRWVKSHLSGFSGAYLPSETVMSWRVDTLIQVYFGDKLEVLNFPITKSQEDYVRFKLFRLLDGLPRSTIQSCPGCNKYFVNPSRRRKSFCSPRCMWKVNTAKRREADREGYNKYQSMLKKDLLREKKGLSRKKTKSRKAKKGE